MACGDILAFIAITLCGDGEGAKAGTDVAQNCVSAKPETAEATQIRMRCATVMPRFLLMLSALFFAGSGHGIIIRHDVGQAAYDTRSIDYPAVFFLSVRGCAKFVLPL